MDDHLIDELTGALSAERGDIVRVPALVRGDLRLPPPIAEGPLRAAAARAAREAPAGAPAWIELDQAQALVQPLVDPTTLAPAGELQILLLPRLEPAELIEPDARRLHELPFREVLDYVAALRDTLAARGAALRAAARCMSGGSALAPRAAEAVFDALPDLLDPQALGEAVDRELGSPEAPGRRYLDEWVPAGATAHRGITARMADVIFAAPRPATGPLARAMPTRQLHITAGNSPLIPVLSFLRAAATKGAAAIKSPAEATPVAALLALAMRSVDPAHPMTRRTSLIYWRGGDRRMEDALLTPAAFDRLVLWGSAEAVRSLGARAGAMRTVIFGPRHGVSLIAREAFPDRIDEAAALACADSVIANQRACIASLVHYVEGSEEEALAYCHALRAALSAWDRGVPQRPPREALGALRRLRRGEWLQGTWLRNGPPAEPTSHVVYLRRPFDVALHPMGRCVVVRRVDDLRDALPYLSCAIASVGVYPESARDSLRDAIAAAGAGSVLPLGEAERAYPGMPHDGMRVLGELVRWANA